MNWRRVLVVMLAVAFVGIIVSLDGQRRAHDRPAPDRPAPVPSSSVVATQH